MENGEVPELPVNETEQLKELEEWAEKVTNAEKEKASILLLKLAADENRRNLREELVKLKELENQKAMEHMTRQEEHQRQLSEIKEHNSELSREIQSLKAKLAAKKLQSEELRQTFRLRKAIPEKKVKFMRLESTTDGAADGNICCHFRISSEVPIKLNQGEALITFEEEDVAQELIRKHEHHVNLENGKTTILKAQPVTLETGVAFERVIHLWNSLPQDVVMAPGLDAFKRCLDGGKDHHRLQPISNLLVLEFHARISLTRIAVSNIPNLNIPKEWMQDKLELHFLKLGGGEVQNVSYDKPSQTALITFAQAKAAKDIVRFGACPFHASGQTHRIQVSPSLQGMVEEFQMFSGISQRTILLTGIAGVEEDEESVQDMIAIHFQKPSNGGGEVEHIQYISKGTKAAYFETGDIILYDRLRVDGTTSPSITFCPDSSQNSLSTLNLV